MKYKNTKKERQWRREREKETTSVLKEPTVLIPAFKGFINFISNSTISGKEMKSVKTS